ncbi:hypothetical protein DL95DRAFT_428572 [Leptodontidium sp. 2 PMI_412]|nr:hypothetical protein DL95DRAFT_428572 [Leptodontidium sp. 2 PMI_412]
MVVHKVAVYIFPGGDLLDFSIQTGALVYVTNASFEEIAAKIEDYDILVIPGSHGDMIKALIASDEGKQHSALTKKNSLRFHHATESVRTGAILVATSGVLSNRTVTTHHLNFDELKEITDQTAGDDSKITIEAADFVVEISEFERRSEGWGMVTSSCF